MDKKELEHLIDRYDFMKVGIDEYLREYWTLEIWHNEFELYCEPEIDVRYLKAPLDELETALEELF